VVMFAGGTGIAPFVGMLEARAAQPGGGENWLFFGARSGGELHYAATWERLGRAGRLQLRTALSREGARRRIDREMLEPENAERLRALARDGAHFYVCGRTGFAKTVMLAMQAVLGGEAGLSAGREQLYRLVGQDRYLQEIFTTYPGAQFLERKLLNASEVVMHNSARDGYWMVINGRVYDVSEFGRMHAGGLKIIQSYAGMDATVAYRRAQHDVNPEVDSLTGMFEIGVVRRLDFGSEWGTAVSPKGLRFVALSDLYEAFVRFLYAVVEMENALQNDLSISDEQVTYDEKRGSPRTSPYRLQLRMQTHERFMRDYLSGVTGPVLEHLWTITCGLCSERLDSRFIKQELLAIEAAPAARQTRELTWERVAARGTDALDELAQLTEALAEEDRRFLREAKLALRRGVEVFEALERDTLSQGRRALVESVRSLPRVLSDYYRRVDEHLASTRPAR
jgi:cytochrome b involved in lipid metabolism